MNYFSVQRGFPALLTVKPHTSCEAFSSPVSPTQLLSSQCLLTRSYSDHSWSILLFFVAMKMKSLTDAESLLFLTYGLQRDVWLWCKAPHTAPSPVAGWPGLGSHPSRGEGVQLCPGPACVSLHLTSCLVMFCKESSCPLEPGLRSLDLFHLKVNKESILQWSTDSFWQTKTCFCKLLRENSHWICYMCCTWVCYHVLIFFHIEACNSPKCFSPFNIFLSFI